MVEIQPDGFIQVDSLPVSGLLLRVLSIRVVSR